MAAPIQLSRRKVAKRPGVRWDALSEFLAFADSNRLTAVQKIAYLAYDYCSTVNVAGHREYFIMVKDANHEERVAALRTVGAHEQADILAAARRAVDLAANRAPAEYENRFLAGVEFADLIEFDDAFERCSRSVPDAVLTYITMHEPEFIEWKP